MRVMAFGEILWDIIEGKEHLGGAPFNFAAHAAQCGSESFIVSRLGNDPLGQRAFDQCKRQRVSQRFIQWDEEHPTGTVDVSLLNGQPDYVIHSEVAYDFIQPDLCVLSPGEHFDVFYFGSLAQRQPVSASTLHKILNSIECSHIFYDVNLRKEGYSGNIISWSLKACNIFKLNTDELPVISKMLFEENLSQQDFCKRITGHFPNIRIIIITASEKGCFIFENQSMTHCAGVPVKVVDAVGAGDAFSAAFMHTYCGSGNAILAAKIANMVGAYVATQPGAIPDYSYSIKEILKADMNSIENASESVL